MRYMTRHKQECIEELEVLVGKFDSLIKGSPGTECKTYYQACLTETLLALSQVKALVIV